MNEIKIFKNPAFGKIRTVGTSEEPLFCLADICRVLGINNATDAKKRLKEDGVDSIEVIDSMGRTQRAHFINEQNLYRLIMRSDKPIAEPFQDWVCGDVLPSIRKTGKYGLPQTFAEALRLAAEQQEKIERQQKALQESAHEIAVLNGVVMQMQPKVTFADAIVGSKASCLVGELAKVLTQNGITIGQNKLFEWLRNNGYLGKKGERYNIPNQQYVEQGLFEIKKGVRSGNDGVMHTTITTKVTGKGQCYFINKFKNTSAVK